MVKRVRGFRRNRKAKQDGSVAIVAKAMVFDYFRAVTLPLWLPVVAIRGAIRAVGRVFRQAQVEGAAARRKGRRAERLAAAEAADE